MGIEEGMNEGELGFLGNALVGRGRVRMAGTWPWCHGWPARTALPLPCER